MRGELEKRIKRSSSLIVKVNLKFVQTFSAMIVVLHQKKSLLSGKPLSVSTYEHGSKLKIKSAEWNWSKSDLLGVSCGTKLPSGPQCSQQLVDLQSSISRSVLS